MKLFQMNIRLDPVIKERLREFCFIYRVTKTEVIRQALTAYMDNHGK
jgi:predicted transcriptional regulator